MALKKKPLTLENLREVVQCLQQMSNDDLEKQGFLLIQKKFPEYVSDLGKATDVASLVKYERSRRKQSFSHLL